MTKLCTGYVALAVLMASSVVYAADVAPNPINKTPPLAPSWTGFYLGFGVGYRTTRTDVSLESETSNLLAREGGFGQPYDGTGFRASPYAGFNWQFAPQWVAGIEADAGLNKQTTTRGGIPLPSLLVQAELSGADTLSVRTTWDASVRGRVGYLLTPSTLAYVTGGIAWQRYEFTSTCQCRLDEIGFFLSPTIAIASTTRAGWTIGGGLETAISGRWLARTEYRYSDFGTFPFAVERAGELDNDPLSSADSLNVKLRSHMATFGLAYKFGDPIAGPGTQAFASATPGAMSWSGFYAGLGLGVRMARDDLTETTLAADAVPVSLDGVASNQSFDGTAFRASPYVGINWQFAPQWVAGLEADAGFGGQKTTLPGFVSPAQRGLSGSDFLAVKTTWDASLRGRIGYLLTPATLVYATTGIAWQHYNVLSVCSSPECTAISSDTLVLGGEAISASKLKMGWTVGGGIEAALWDHWRIRAEYRYADFGTSSFTVTRPADEVDVNTVTDVFDVNLRTHTVTFGLAYLFN
jgi:outer membrane immunogenic protein